MLNDTENGHLHLDQKVALKRKTKANVQLAGIFFTSMGETTLHTSSSHQKT